MTLDADVNLWKHIVRSQANRIESGPSLASLISNEPSTTLIYGVLAGILAGSILPSWIFFMILVGTAWYVYNRMPPALILVIQKTLEGAMQGTSSSNSSIQCEIQVSSKEVKEKRTNQSYQVLRIKTTTKQKN